MAVILEANIIYDTGKEGNSQPVTMTGKIMWYLLFKLKK